MPDGLLRPTPKSQYTLYDMVDKKPARALGEFDSLTGGEQVISMVKYNVIDDRGNVTTKFIPGQTTFEPFVLLRPMDIVAQEIYFRFAKAIAGELKKLKRHYTIAMNDSRGQPLVYWNLYDALPIKLSGFEFNMTTENEYTSFEISFQAEFVEVIFDESATSENVTEAIDYWTAKESGELEEEEEDTGDDTIEGS